MLIGSVVISAMLASKTLIINDLSKLQQAYPDYVQSVSIDHITLRDGTEIPTNTLTNQVSAYHYTLGKIDLHTPFNMKNDAGRYRNETFFKKMYGGTKEEVEKHLVWIEWMPHIFKDERGQALYRLQVTTVNGVADKLKKISNELEQLPTSDYKFLQNPAGTYMWRNIANTDRLSPHSFGMTIDINTDYTSYWQWDLTKEQRPIAEETQLTYHENQIPWEIILIFEKHGFIWGGKWYHYDTMHFEYRPELLGEYHPVL